MEQRNSSITGNFRRHKGVHVEFWQQSRIVKAKRKLKGDNTHDQPYTSWQAPLSAPTRASQLTVNQTLNTATGASVSERATQFRENQAGHSTDTLPPTIRF